MSDTTFVPGTVIANRSRLWHVDAHEGGALVAISIDGGRTEQCKFHALSEDAHPDRLSLLSSDIVGHLSAQDLPIQAHHFNLPHNLAFPHQLTQPYHPQGRPTGACDNDLGKSNVRIPNASNVGLGKTITGEPQEEKRYGTRSLHSHLPCR